MNVGVAAAPACDLPTTLLCMNDGPTRLNCRLVVDDDCVGDECEEEARTCDDNEDDCESPGDGDREAEGDRDGEDDIPAGRRCSPSEPSLIALSPSRRQHMGWPDGSANQLKLSVGGAESEDEDEELDGDECLSLEEMERRRVDELRENMKQWHLRFGPQQEDNEWDMELSKERIQAIIAGENLMFQPLSSGNIVDEVFSEKKPKINRGYLFGDVVGEGSYAKVKEVVEQQTLVRRAVKIIKGNRLRRIPNGQENVDREIKILRRVHHPNVIQLVEVFRNEEKNKLYMVMEFCMGSVQQLLDTSPGKRLPEPEAHRYFRELVSGLDYIHSIGIVHKDIKPGNLLLAPDFTLKISDFGVAEELSVHQSDDTCSVVQGTPKFQAPELVSGATKEFSGFKADIWSSGVSLYNMVSGEYPFDGEVIMRLFDNIAHQSLEMPQNMEIGQWLETLLRGMMEKDPTKRWNLDSIRHSEWFLKTFSKEEEHSAFPDRKHSVYRPLTVSRALEQMYGKSLPPGRLVSPNDLNETMGSLGGDASMGSVGVSQSAGQIVLPPHSPPEDMAARRPEDPPRRNRSFFTCLLPNRSP